MIVEAVKLGYYDLKRRKEGERFEISDPKHFSTKWMKTVGASVAPGTSAPESPAAQAEIVKKRGRPSKNVI